MSASRYGPRLTRMLTRLYEFNSSLFSSIPTVASTCDPSETNSPQSTPDAASPPQPSNPTVKPSLEEAAPTLLPAPPETLPDAPVAASMTSLALDDDNSDSWSDDDSDSWSWFGVRS